MVTGCIRVSHMCHTYSIAQLCHQSKTDHGKTKYQQEHGTEQLPKAQSRNTISNCEWLWELLKPQTSAQPAPAENHEAPLLPQTRALQKNPNISAPIARISPQRICYYLLAKQQLPTKAGISILVWQAQGCEMITVFTFPLLTIKSHSAALPRMTEANKIQAFGRKQ